MAKSKNMGKADRLIRGVIGYLLISNGKKQRGLFGFVQTVAGGMFLMNSVTGSDPVLAHFGASTRGNAENNLFNLMKHALPGNSTNSSDYEQAVSKKQLEKNGKNGRTTLADALAL